VARLALTLLALAWPVGASAQGFPGEAPAPPSFPTAVYLFAIGGWTGDRAVRTYDVGQPNPNDPACDAVRCQTVLGAGSAPGVGARLQLPLSRRAGLRAGLSIAGPKPQVQTLDGNLVRLDRSRVAQLRGELLLLFRMKRHVPVFFGLGGALTRYQPGLAPDQDNSTDVGGVVAVGYDAPLKPPLGVRIEWTAYLMVPSSTGWPAEYEPKSFAFDHQLSVGLAYHLRRAGR